MALKASKNLALSAFLFSQEWPMCNEFDISPLQTWRSLDHAQRITLIAATLALLGFGVLMFVLFGGASMSAL